MIQILLIKAINQIENFYNVKKIIVQNIKFFQFYFFSLIPLFDSVFFYYLL